MKAKVQMNKKAIKHLTETQKTALHQAVEAVKTDVIQKKVMPFDTGTIQNENTFVDDSKLDSGSASLVSDTPYARRLYFHPEYEFNQDNNANAQGAWLEDWINGSRADFIKKAYAARYKKLTEV